MTVTEVAKDPAALTLTVTSEWDAPIERVWQLWSDPRRLERWWGPPTYPAKVSEHDLRPGGTVAYCMTGPDGDEYRGCWNVGAVEAPHHLAFVDAFANADGTVNDDLPLTSADISLSELDNGRTRMVMITTFPSPEAMEQVLAMGVEEGMLQAMSQIAAVLADG